MQFTDPNCWSPVKAKFSFPKKVSKLPKESKFSQKSVKVAANANVPAVSCSYSCWPPLPGGSWPRGRTTEHKRWRPDTPRQSLQAPHPEHSLTNICILGYLDIWIFGASPPPRTQCDQYFDIFIDKYANIPFGYVSSFSVYVLSMYISTGKVRLIFCLCSVMFCLSSVYVLVKFQSFNSTIVNQDFLSKVTLA